MPSRPVLIGRGLVPTTYTTTHAIHHASAHVNPPRANHNERTTHVQACSRPLSSSQPTNPTPLIPPATGCGESVHRQGFEQVERVTAAIAKRETPGPIPNPEVKPFSADGTATERLWESRTPPDKHCESGVTFGWLHFCISGHLDRAPQKRSRARFRPQACSERGFPQDLVRAGPGWQRLAAVFGAGGAP